MTVRPGEAGLGNTSDERSGNNITTETLGDDGDPSDEFRLWNER